MRKSVFYTVLLLSLAYSPFSMGAEFWTATIKGMHTTTTGAAAIQLAGAPTAPNPAGTVWQSCRSNFVYFHQDENGQAINDEAINRMLSVAMAAWVAEKNVRLGIKRDSSGKCYTSQIFPSNP